MAGIITRFGMAMRAAIAAFRDPGGFPGSPVETEIQSYLNFLWSCYRNTQFDDLAAWARYREKFQLYRNIRSVYNPTRRLVNFYVAQVYPGVLSEDGDQLPDGVQLAIPFSKDTDPKLSLAVAQFWQWSNWQSGNKLMVRFGGATGSCLVEIDDNVLRGKVSASVKWPGLVSYLVLDDVGNVKTYHLEYQAKDEEDKAYTFRKEVTQESFKYFKDDVPFIPDGKAEAEEDNPYGFVPAVWCKHMDEGDDYGVPAIAGSIGKIDELNGLVSHTHDQVDILIDSPGIIAATGSVGRLEQQSADRKTAAQDEFAAVGATKEKPTKRMILKGPADTKWVTMAGNLDPAAVIPHIKELIMELEHDFPELGMYQELRKMSQVTGPGAARMMGDVYSRVLEVSSNYDTQSIKLFQMAVAIGGMRLKEGREGWAQKNDQRNKFAPFNLDSYSQGNLNMAIMPRPLIPMTEDDTISLTGKRLDNATKAKDVFSERRVLEVAGITDEQEQSKEIMALALERERDALTAPNGAGMGRTMNIGTRLVGAEGMSPDTMVQVSMNKSQGALNAPPGVRGLLNAKRKNGTK